MTIGKTTIKIDEIFKNAKASNADFTESVISLGKELGTLPPVAQKAVTLFSEFEKIKLPDDEIKNFATNFVNLSEAEKKAALNFVSFESASQQDKFNTNVSDLSSGTALNSSLFQQELATKSLDEQTQKLILTEAGLIDSHGKYNIISESQAQANIKASQTFSALTDTQKAEVLAAEADVIAKQSQKSANTSLIASNGALAISFEVVKKAMIGIGIGLAVTAVAAGVEFLVQKVDDLIVTSKELESQSEQAKAAYDSESQAVKDLETQIEDLTQKIKELKASKADAANTDVVSDDDISKLESERSILEAQLNLEKALAQEKAKESNAAAYELLNKNSKVSRYQGNDKYQFAEDSNGSTGTGSGFLTNQEYLLESIQHYNEVKQQIADLIEKHKNQEISDNEYQKLFDNLNSDLEDTKSEINSTMTEISEVGQRLIDDGTNAYQKEHDAVQASSDAYNEWYTSVYGATDALKENTESAQDSASTLADINTVIDGIQSAYKSLNSAVQEYNTNGAISMDTLQEILALDDKYVNCLVDQNGKLSLNMTTFQELTKLRLQEAEAAAIQQAMEELANVTAESEVETAGAVCGAIGDKVNALAVLGEQYGNVTGCATAYGQAEALVMGYQSAYAKNSAKATEIMSALDKKLELIHNTMNSVSGSAQGAANALGGFSDSAKDASSAANKLKDSLNQQKDALEKEQKQLKAYGEAIIDNLDKQIDKLKKEKELQDKIYEDEIDDLKDKKDALEKANDEEDRAIKLAELQEALEKAKSSKVRIYTHDKGFEWGVDESKVQDAQNNLDDQIRENNREDVIQGIEDEIDALEKLKDAYDDSIDAQIDKIEAVKDKWQESIDLIGTSWDEYQMKLDAAAKASGMTLEEIANSQASFNDSVIANMQALYDVEQQLTEAENALSDAKNAGTGSSYTAGAAIDEMLPKYQALLDEMKALSEKNNELNSELDVNKTTYSNLSQSIHEVADKLRDATEGTDEYNKLTDQYNRLAERRSEISDNITLLQGEIADNEGKLTEKTAEYLEALSNETDMTEEERNAQLNALIIYCQEYGVNYDKVAAILDAYIEKMAGEGGITEQNEAAYENMRSVIEQFSTDIDQYMEDSVKSVQKLIDKLDEAIRKKKEAGVGSSGGYATGTVNVKRSGIYHVDEEGPELIARQSANGRYTYLEQGDGVIPASYSRNLWNIGSNPSAWFEQQYNKFARSSANEKIVTAGGLNYDTTIGDIYINQPVGDVNTLAKAIQRELPNAARRMMTKR